MIMYTLSRCIHVIVFRAISTENKGHKLLAKMGWKEGEGLGKSQQGLAEPVSNNGPASIILHTCSC